MKSIFIHTNFFFRFDPILRRPLLLSPSPNGKSAVGTLFVFEPPRSAAMAPAVARAQ